MSAPKIRSARKWLIGVAAVILLACTGAPSPAREGKACDRLGRTVAHRGTVLTCKQGPGKDRWTWQRDERPHPIPMPNRQPNGPVSG